MELYSIFKRSNDNNLLVVCMQILDFFHVNHTKFSLKNAIKAHVDAPSLLTLKDVLAEYGIESAAIYRGANPYSDFETPFACSIQREGWASADFTIVQHADEKSVSYLDPVTRNIASISLDAFEKIDKGVLLLMDSSTSKDEVNYAKNVKAERLHNLTQQLPFCLFALSILLVGIQIFQRLFSTESVIAALFLSTSATGLLISILLLWHDIDKHNPFIREVCGGIGKKMDCNAVLSSAGASLFGISWSIWGFAYFSTFFIFHIFLTGNDELFSILSYGSIAVSPYIFYSLYYQWKKVRQWCPLCLAIQFLLLVNLVLSIVGWANGVLPKSIGIYTLPTVLITMLTFLIITYKAVPLIRRASESEDYEMRWKKLRYHPDIFQSLLNRSEQMKYSAQGIGIVVGNPLARNEIIKVCNPYCGPCAKAHPEIHHIIKNNQDVKVRIIFTASGEDHDLKTAPVKHLLAIQDRYSSKDLYIALDDWYLAEKKDYTVFAEKYPMNGELNQQERKIKAMREWCDNMKIRATPTFYINGKELPESYRVNELKMFF